MPPKDESASAALDDAIVFARTLASYYTEPLQSAFEIYESIRRRPIEDAYKEACAGWERHKDKSQLMERLQEWLTPLYLRRTKKFRKGAWVFNAGDVHIPRPGSTDSTASSRPTSVGTIGSKSSRYTTNYVSG